MRDILIYKKNRLLLDREANEKNSKYLIDDVLKKIYLVKGRKITLI